MKKICSTICKMAFVCYIFSVLRFSRYHLNAVLYSWSPAHHCTYQRQWGAGGRLSLHSPPQVWGRPSRDQARDVHRMSQHTSLQGGPRHHHRSNWEEGGAVYVRIWAVRSWVIKYMSRRNCT